MRLTATAVSASQQDNQDSTVNPNLPVNEFYLRETGVLAGGIPKEEVADIDFTAPAPDVEEVDDVLKYRAVGSSRFDPPIIAPPAGNNRDASMSQRVY